MLRLKTLVTALIILCVSAGAAYGAGDGEHAPLWGNFGLRVLNFALFIGIITYFFGRKILAFFQGRKQSIADELAGLETQKAEAAKYLEEIGERISNLESERQAILKDYEAQGQALKAAIIAQAEKNAAHIIEQAKSTARNEMHQAMDELRSQMADQIVAETERLLKERLTPSEHEQLIDKYLTKVVLN